MRLVIKEMGKKLFHYNLTACKAFNKVYFPSAATFNKGSLQTLPPESNTYNKTMHSLKLLIRIRFHVFAIILQYHVFKANLTHKIVHFIVFTAYPDKLQQHSED